MNATEQPFSDGASLGLSQTTELSFEKRLTLFTSLKNTGDTFRLRTAGVSMLPTIRGDSVVDVTFCPAGQITAGDVILFYGDDSFVLHRVMQAVEREGKRYFVEKGDHQPFHGALSEKQYLGRVTAIRTGNRLIDCASRQGRRQARFLLGMSRLEMRLYAWKTSLLGKRPTLAGRAVMRCMRVLKRGIARTGGGR